MSKRYILAPGAVQDLGDIWEYLHNEAGREMADTVDSAIRDRIAFLSSNNGIGHWRRDLTSENVKFFSVYSYLIVYRPETNPLQVVSILHGHRDVQVVLRSRI